MDKIKDLKDLCRKLRNEVRAPLDVCLKILKEVDLDYDLALERVRESYKHLNMGKGTETFTRGHVVDSRIIYVVGESGISVRSEAIDRLLNQVIPIIEDCGERDNLRPIDPSHRDKLRECVSAASLSLKESVSLVGWFEFDTKVTSTYLHTLEGNDFFSGAVLSNLPGNFGPEIHWALGLEGRTGSVTYLNGQSILRILKDKKTIDGTTCVDKQITDYLNEKGLRPEDIFVYLFD